MNNGLPPYTHTYEHTRKHSLTQTLTLIYSCLTLTLTKLQFTLYITTNLNQDFRNDLLASLGPGFGPREDDWSWQSWCLYEKRSPRGKKNAQTLTHTLAHKHTSFYSVNNQAVSVA